MLGLNKTGIGSQTQDTLAHGAAGSAPGFIMGGANNLRLDFDNTTNLVSAYINGVQMMAPNNPFAGVYPNNGGYEPVITASGFHTCQGDAQESTADNFSLVITDSVPEPGRFALLGCGVSRTDNAAAWHAWPPAKVAATSRKSGNWQWTMWWTTVRTWREKPGAWPVASLAWGAMK